MICKLYLTASVGGGGRRGGGEAEAKRKTDTTVVAKKQKWSIWFLNIGYPPQGSRSSRISVSYGKMFMEVLIIVMLRFKLLEQGRPKEGRFK